MTEPEPIEKEESPAYMKPSDPRTICASLDEIDGILAEQATDPFDL